MRFSFRGITKPSCLERSIRWIWRACAKPSKRCARHATPIGTFSSAAGSAATASHFVTDMVKGASFNRDSRFRIMALTDSLSTITAYSNDVSYECIFAEQLKNFAQPGDVLMAISGSGNSPNVLCAVEYANSLGCETIALTGRDGGKLGPLAKLQVRVAEPHMGRIEDGHMIVCHMICYYFMEN
jgi:D-sedoheptulose 7-phosphate isomerase